MSSTSPSVIISISSSNEEMSLLSISTSSSCSSTSSSSRRSSSSLASSSSCCSISLGSEASVSCSFFEQAPKINIKASNKMVFLKYFFKSVISFYDQTIKIHY